MRVRRWIYVAAGTAFVAVIALVAHDQLLVEYGDDSSYLLGKATPSVTWILTLVTPFALYDFFTWLRRSHIDVIWWAVVVVLTSFTIAWYLARGWSLEWLVERDIEITFGRDEFLDVVVGLWSTCLAALTIWISLRLRKAVIDPNLRAEVEASG